MIDRIWAEQVAFEITRTHFKTNGYISSFSLEQTSQRVHEKAICLDSLNISSRFNLNASVCYKAKVKIQRLLVIVSYLTHSHQE